MKSSKLHTFLFCAFIFSSNAFAISNEELANKCLEVGTVKVAAQAEALGCKIDLNLVEVQEIDNRWYNPSKYVWYQVVGQCAEYDRVVKMVQYYKGKCF